MSAFSNDDEGVTSSLSGLSITKAQGDSFKPSKPTKKKAKKVVVESWEDDDASDTEPAIEPEKSDEDEESAAHDAPGSTPSATSFSSDAPTWTPGPDTHGFREQEPEKRPEKTDAVARRMIVAGLGLKAPKLTDEQRAYQRSVREQEKKKREQERELEKRRKEEAERAKASVWDD